MMQNNFTSPADIQQPATQPDAIKQMVINEVNSIQTLVRTGALTPQEGQNLMNYVTQRAYSTITQQQGVGTSGMQAGAEQQPAARPQTMQQPSLTIENPEFFNRDGRKDVLDYLNTLDTGLDRDEVSKISTMIENIEKSAVDRYLKEIEHEKTLNSENESAKLRLRANAQNAVSDGTTNRVFTREQIGKMSGAEFAKNEKMIMEQLRKGQIK